MPISDPRVCRDHSEDWRDYFYRRRGGEILQMITPEVIEEHLNNANQSLGMHSQNLHLVLNFFRAAPIIGKKFVYTAKANSAYRVAVVTERGTPVVMADEKVYSSEREAIHAVFLARVDDLKRAVHAETGALAS